jgi:biotin carboxyl carrier protein
MKYQIEIGGNKREIEKIGDRFRFENQDLAFDFHTLTSDQAVVRIENELFTVRLLEIAEDGKTISAEVNGKRTEIGLKSETDLLLEKFGVGNSSQLSSKKVKAPMPGLIVKVQSAVGDEVEKGHVLLNFEAMKMENQLKAPGAGKIKAILVVQGDKVEKGQLLVEFE